MKRRILLLMISLAFCAVPVKAEPIRWVDFGVPYESLRYAMERDIETAQQELHLSWIDILAVAACRTGGRCPEASVRKAEKQLLSGASPEEVLGDLYRLYPYYYRSFDAILGGLLGNYQIIKEGESREVYGLKAYSPIAAGYSYSHYADFGNCRSFGFARKHLGNDLMGNLGTPITAIEGGVVEAMGWNRYGGWRIGIRSFDSKRYYYYAHLQKDHPYAENLKPGDLVQAGDLLGFMGRTGYSDRENVNNIEAVHLHLGLELIFEESQKECNSEIWIDVYNLVRLLDSHRSTIQKTADGWKRKYIFMDLDNQPLFGP